MPRTPVNAPAPEVRDAGAIRGCRSCGEALRGEYCHACGERARGIDDEGLLDYLDQFWRAWFGAEGRLLRTFWTLGFRPGELSRSYRAGLRLQFLRPVQLFFVCALLYFLFQRFTGYSTYFTGLELQVERQSYSALIEPTVAAELVRREALGASPQDARNQLRTEYDAQASVVSRSLTVLAVPLFALGAGLVCRRRSYRAVSHLVFSTHFLCFSLTYFGLVFAGLAPFVFRLPLPNRLLGVLEHVLGGEFGSMLPALVWLILGVRRFYGFDWPASVLRGLLLVLWHALSLMVYRFLMFWLTWFSL